MLISAARMTGTRTGTDPQAQSRAAGSAQAAKALRTGEVMAFFPAWDVRIESLAPRENYGQLRGRHARQASRGRRATATSAYTLHVEEEVHHVAVLDDVVLPFDAQGAPCTSRGLASGAKQLVPADHFRLDET